MFVFYTKYTSAFSFNTFWWHYKFDIRFLLYMVELSNAFVSLHQTHFELYNWMHDIYRSCADGIFGQCVVASAFFHYIQPKMYSNEVLWTHRTNQIEMKKKIKLGSSSLKLMITIHVSYRQIFHIHSIFYKFETKTSLLNLYFPMNIARKFELRCN